MGRARKRILRIGLISLAILVGSAGVSFATTRLAVEPGVIEACYVTKTGILRKVQKDAACVAGESRIAWNTVGPKGDPGTPFDGTFTSPNGLFSISVTNSGIELSGPTTRVEVSGATVRVTAPTVQLNGCSAPVARVGDTIVGNGFSHPDGGAVPVTGFVTGGLPTVCAG